MKNLNTKLQDWIEINKLIREAKPIPTSNQTSELNILSDEYLKKYGKPFNCQEVFLDGYDDLK